MSGARRRPRAADAGPQSLCVSCNACATVCPVGIDLPRQILDVRHRVAEEYGLPWYKRPTILFGAAEVLREAGGIQHTTEEDELRKPYLAASRARLDEGSWRAAWAQGRAMSMKQAIEYALSEEKPLPSSSPESEQSSSDEPPSLTRREKEVAVLVGRGMTNRQIASQLVLSEHTVHHHVTNILKKLNLSSRQQVASCLSDR